MKILNRYIGSTVISMTCLVVLIIIGIQIFIGVIAELSHIGRGTYGVKEALVFVFSSMPFLVYPLFPAAALIGGLLALGRLATYSELIVMRAAGMSKWEITLSVMRATVIMLIFVTAIGELAGPPLKNFADNYRDVAEKGLEATKITQGVWIRDDNNFLHIDQVDSSGKLQGIIRYSFQQAQLQSASHAASGDYVNGKWLFKDINQSTFSPDHVSTQHFTQQFWPLSFDPKLVAAQNINIAQTSLWDLQHNITYLKDSGLSSSNYEFAFWKRLFQPLVTLVMIALGVPFIFGPLRTVTMGSRMLIGVVIGFGFYTFNEFLGPFTLVYQVPPLLSASMPLLIFIVIDALVWRKAK